ncbi:MAG: tyrosine-type recombinase/integrase [Gammaproteobacteria bacterium]|nr:tyrosine-type recombinase/integrase [Gammaproteobacteria bacterium]
MPIRDYFFISLFVGARRSNILAMRWDEINLTTKVWRIPDTKSGEAVSVPLSEAAMGILLKRHEESNSPYVFSSKTSATGHLVEPKKGWARVLKRANIKNRVEPALTEPALSHHGTCDVAYRGFKLAFNKTKPLLC